VPPPGEPRRRANALIHGVSWRIFRNCVRKIAAWRDVPQAQALAVIVHHLARKRQCDPDTIRNERTK